MQARRQDFVGGGAEYVQFQKKFLWGLGAQVLVGGAERFDGGA